MSKIGFIAEIRPPYRTTCSRHIVDGYSAGHYRCPWPEVPDADTFEPFKAHGMFDRKTRPAPCVITPLAKVAPKTPCRCKIHFLGRKAAITPLLNRRGLQ